MSGKEGRRGGHDRLPLERSWIGEPVQDVVCANDDAADDVAALVSDWELEHVPDVKGERYRSASLMRDRE